MGRCDAGSDASLCRCATSGGSDGTSAGTIPIKADEAKARSADDAAVMRHTRGWPRTEPGSFERTLPSRRGWPRVDAARPGLRGRQGDRRAAAHSIASEKSSVAAALAQRLPLAAHVRGDAFRRMVVAGRAETTPPLSAAGQAQLQVRHRLAALVADGYAEAGIAAVVQDLY